MSRAKRHCVALRATGKRLQPQHRRMSLERLEQRTLLSAGDLDPTFGIGGKVLADFSPGPGSDEARQVIAVQPDGKVLVAGTSMVAGNADFALVRYDAYGSLSSSKFADFRPKAV